MYTRSTLFIAAALFAGSVAAAEASDIDNGDVGSGIKDQAIEAIPVPGNIIEIPETVSWYLRGDYGYGFSTDADITVGGGGVANDIGDGKNSYSLGFGRYLSPNLRADIVFDYRNDDMIFSESGTFTESIRRAGNVSIEDPLNPGTAITVNDTITFQIDTIGTDEVTFHNHTALANLYYDFNGLGRFKPYIGGGLGIAIYDLQRDRQGTYDTCRAFAQAAALADPVGNPTGQLLNCDISQDDIDAASQPRSESTVGVGFAAALMAGVSIELRDNVHFDTNYRYTWQGGDVTTASSFGGAGGTTINVGDRSDHEIRFGIRYDIW